MISKRKIHNTRSALDAKLMLRRQVLAHVSPARVLDAFCGDGVMYGAVWKAAREYVPCDRAAWDPGDPVRFVCDNRRLLRCLDLLEFNVFDFDAFGSPWEQVVILAARRKWERGEKGALVVTDGSALQIRWGEMSVALAELIEAQTLRTAPTLAGMEGLHRIAMANFARRSGVSILHQWEAQGRGRAQQYYAAIVFEGA